MTDWKYVVPDVIEPAETICVSIEVPNDLKHIAAFWGALRELGDAWNWEDGYDTGYLTSRVWLDVIASASEATRIGENCMVDCGDIEDCLETSTIITTIEGDVIINAGDITDNVINITNNTNVVNNILSGGDDTNVYPALPTTAEPDELCGAAYKVASEIIILVEQTVLDVGLLTIASWLLALLGIGGWLATNLSLLWTYILANEIALTGVDFDIYKDEIAEALYCAELDMAQAIIDLDPAIPTLRRDAIIKAMDSVTDAQVALWAFVGSLDDTQDCSAFACVDWCAVINFLPAKQGWVQLPFGDDPESGLWIAGQGWAGDSIGGLDFGMLGEKPFALSTLTEVIATIHWGPLKVNRQSKMYGIEDDDTEVLLDSVTPSVPNADYTLTWNGEAEYKAIRIRLAQSISSEFVLEQLKISGLASDPFELDNC